MNLRRGLMLSAVAVASGLPTPSEAQARRRGIRSLFQTGDYMFQLADIPADAPCRSEPGIPSDIVVGYKCQRFAVLWLNLWTWDGEYCLYSEAANRVSTGFTREQLAMLAGISTDRLKEPFLYSVPLGWIVIAGVVGLGIAYKAGRASGATSLSMPPATSTGDTKRTFGV
jgi:hypothetical protein